MERPIFKPIGTPVVDLDTPALVIDLDILEQNLTTVHTFFRRCHAKLRPEVSTHGCPALAHKQIAAGGTVGGIAVATLGEAEVFVTHGIDDIVMTHPIVTRAKLQRLCALARQGTMTVAVDHPTQVQQLTDAATANDVTIQVAVTVETDAQGWGIVPGPGVLDLIRALEGATHLSFVGLITTVGAVLAAQPQEDLAAQTRQTLLPLIETYAQLERAGVEVSMVSVGGITMYEPVAALDGVTEVRLGTYAIMDAGHAPYAPSLHPAAHILTTVTSRPEPGTAITDAGQKAVGIDLGLPVVRDGPGIAAMALSAEHCRLGLADEVQGTVALGDRLWLTPWDIGTCMNLYDAVYGARRGRLEVVWPISARGRYR